MQRFKNILYVYDEEATDSEALHRAIILARNNNARLKVVHALKDFQQEVRTFLGPEKLPDLKEKILRIYKENLDHMVSDARNDGLQISTKLLFGKAFIELIREVIREKHDLVIMNAAMGEGLKGRFFGSNALHMMRKCPCPVWVIKPGQRNKFSKILAAVDPSLPYDKSDTVKTGLNKKIMELSSSLAHREGSELHIIHTWELYLETMLRNRAGLSQSEMDDLIDNSRHEHETTVYELISRCSLEIQEKQIHILKGRPGYLIPEVVRETGIDLIVMGTVSRTGIAGLLIGNTAEEILDRVDCSVLTVKPDGFVSPVE